MKKKRKKNTLEVQFAFRHESTWLFLQCKVRYCDPVYLFFLYLFHFLLFFIFIWSSFTSFGERDFSMILCPWKVKQILLVRPSCKEYWKYKICIIYLEFLFWKIIRLMKNKKRDTYIRNNLNETIFISEV